MGLYEEAVDLSLEWGNLQLAKLNADAAGQDTASSLLREPYLCAASAHFSVLREPISLCFADCK